MIRKSITFALLAGIALASGSGLSAMRMEVVSNGILRPRGGRCAGWLIKMEKRAFPQLFSNAAFQLESMRLTQGEKKANRRVLGQFGSCLASVLSSRFGEEEECEAIWTAEVEKKNQELMYIFYLMYAKFRNAADIKAQVSEIEGSPKSRSRVKKAIDSTYAERSNEFFLNKGVSEDDLEYFKTLSADTIAKLADGKYMSGFMGQYAYILENDEPSTYESSFNEEEGEARGQQPEETPLPLWIQATIDSVNRDFREAERKPRPMPAAVSAESVELDWGF